MFGYILADSSLLSKEDSKKYRAYYCGLCRSLRDNCGKMSRITLSYDLTFLSVVLSALYKKTDTEKTRRCFLHPFPSFSSVENEFSEYAAYMNVMLSYYKFLDDWNDDKNRIALAEAKIFEKAVKKAEEKFPRQCKVTRDRLAEISAAENADCLNPDIPSGLFGDIMGEIFAMKEDGNYEKLFRFGSALGKYIYTVDAICDLKSDIKKQRYNPLRLCDSGSFDDTVSLLMADVVSAYAALGIEEEKNIIENVLFSGILLKYKAFGRKKNGTGPL